MAGGSKMVDPAVVTAALGIVGSVLAGLFGLRRGRAEAAEVSARADVLGSTEARAFAVELRQELARERDDRRRLEVELEAERRRAAELERRLSEAERRIRDLETALARLGGRAEGGTA